MIVADDVREQGPACPHRPGPAPRTYDGFAAPGGAVASHIDLAEGGIMRCQFEYHDGMRTDRTAVDAWILATDCSDVTEVVVEDLAVVVRGGTIYNGIVFGRALRRGDLHAELTVALAIMRGSFSKPEAEANRGTSGSDLWTTAHPCAEIEFASS